MTSVRIAWLVATGTIVALGCGGGGSGNTGGGGAATTATGAGGDGGATTTTTTTSTGTGTGGSTPLDPSGFACSGATPSLSVDVLTITTQSCATGTGCHAAMDQAPKLIDQFVSRPAEQCLDSRAMIDPGNPERSYLIHKITNHNICTGQTMPKDAALLPDAEIQVIYDWICTGAPNN